MANTTSPTIIPVTGNPWGPEAIGTLTFGLVATILSVVTLIMACVKYAWCPWQNHQAHLQTRKLGFRNQGPQALRIRAKLISRIYALGLVIL
ncbi:hypothetical protein P170DRAFT_470290 [Aspergillus steynii IBT 23096]|uniref:Uncharacterized protein n=1 Tax=Aspergillus steynii IBT 23096 TaxID=1392250 RepID=A0A2I2GPQ0_9EURO|nr:uncharacterized protein P170DRAFT_470290 [Aspergillus steynii IBT 23096]PLB54857.1 hypothetical protein P170DRAFT_470290 [Aspergillus steynii IBT 23096]